MDSIEIVKNFERSGFTRQQAELQVKTMIDLKRDLLTKQDGEHIDSRFDQVDTRFVEVDKRFDLVDRRLDLMDKRINSLEHSMLEGFRLLREDIRLQPLRTTIYTASVLVTSLGLYSYWPIIQNWFR